MTGTSIAGSSASIASAEIPTVTWSTMSPDAPASTARWAFATRRSGRSVMLTK